MTKEWQLQSHQFPLFSPHSVFPFCPLYPSPFWFSFAIIFHYLSFPNIPPFHSFPFPLSVLRLVWTEVYSDVSLVCRGCFLDALAPHLPCCSVPNLHRMFTVWQFLCIVKAMPACTPSNSSPAFFGHAFLRFSSIWGCQTTEEESSPPPPLLSLLLQPVSRI